eukprot:g3344.t1
MNRKTRKTTWTKPCEGEFEKYPKSFTAGSSERKEEGINATTARDDTSLESTKISDVSAKTSKEEEEEDAKGSDVTEAEESAVDTSKSVNGLRPMKTLRRLSLARMKKVWVAVKDGDGMGDVYYKNIKTGETTWEKPSDLEEPSLNESSIQFKEDDDIAECLKILDIHSAAAAKDRDDMKNSGDKEAEHRAYARLDRLTQLMRSKGSDAEWSNVIAADDFALPTFVALHLGMYTSADVRAVAGRCLGFSVEMCPQATEVIVESIGGGSEYWKHFEQSLLEAFSLVSEGNGRAGTDDDAIREWSELTAYCAMYLSSKEKSHRPPQKLVGYLFKIMSSNRLQQKTFLAAARAISFLNIMFTGPLAHNIVIEALIADPSSDHWGEAIIYQLNEQTGKDSPDVRALLKVISDLYSEKKTSNFFYTNDLHVIIDIIIREVVNLPSQSDARVGYLEVLEKVLQTSSWFEKKQYRLKDINSALDVVIDARETDSTFNALASEVARRIKTGCSDLLRAV